MAFIIYLISHDGYSKTSLRVKFFLFALKLRYYHFLEGDEHADAHNAGTKANVDCLHMTEGYDIRQT
jgi:hypothetical protein